MSISTEQNNHSASASAGLKIFVLSFFAIITAIISVSFAAHHLRITFENEYMDQMIEKTESLANLYSLTINGDEIEADPVKAAAKYAGIFPALIIDSGAVGQSTKIYGLYAYNNGTLSALVQSSSTDLIAGQIPVSDWLTAEATPYVIKKPGMITILTPIKDSQAKVVSVFELSSNYSFMGPFGSTLERQILLTVVVSIVAGILLFSLQYVIPSMIRFIKRKGDVY